jgi:hypothetical protein
VLYYAGYAAQVEGRSLLVPVDARLEAQEGLAAGGIGLGELLQSLQEAGNRANVLFLDAVPAARAGVGLVAVPGNCRLALSDQPDRPADPDRPTGAFTAALLKYLRAPGLELETMLRYVRRDVVEATSGQQVPWDSAPLPEPFHLVPAPWDSADGPPIPKALPVGPDYAYVLAVHLGGMWPLAHDLGRTFSATDARLLSAPAPLLELRLWRRLQEVGVPDLGLSALLAWPKTRPATSLPAGHTGLLAGVLGTAEWTVPLGLGRRDPYLAAGGGAWLIKFRRTRVREALHLNPTARLGLGARIHAVGRGVLRVEACYFPLKGPTYLVESGAVCLQYALPF